MMFFSFEALFGVVVAFLCAAGLLVWLTIRSVSRLRRNWRDLDGWLCAIPPVFAVLIVVVPGIDSRLHLRDRAQDVASWPRVALPDPLPKAIIFNANNSSLATNKLQMEFAESGVFDIYLKDRVGRSGGLKRIVLAASDDCFGSSRSRFVAMRSYARCGAVASSETAPENALVYYEDDLAPLAFRGRKGQASDGDIVWVRQISWRHEGREDLIYYAESLKPPPWIGPRSVNWRDGPEPSDLIKTVLGVDLANVRPPIADETDLMGVLARFSKLKEPPVGDVAALYPERKQIIADALTDYLLSPRLNRGLGGKDSCERLSGLARYRAEIDKACALNPAKDDAICGLPRDAWDHWYADCRPDLSPLWPKSRDRWRVVLHAAPSESTSLPTLNIRLRLDDGRIDIALLNAAHLTISGPTVCLGRIILFDPKATVSGAPDERVAYRTAGDADLTPTPNGLSTAALTLLGATPDLRLIDLPSGAVDIGQLLPNGTRTDRCAPHPWRSITDKRTSKLPQPEPNAPNPR